jgi:hypothetical protein
LGIFCTFRFLAAGFVTALSDRFRSGGPFPCQQPYSFNPARPSTAQLAGEMPPLREGDRYFWGYAIGAATALTTFLVPEETEIKTLNQLAQPANLQSGAFERS